MGPYPIKKTGGIYKKKTKKTGSGTFFFPTYSELRIF